MTTRPTKVHRPKAEKQKCDTWAFGWIHKETATHPMYTINFMLCIGPSIDAWFLQKVSVIFMVNASLWLYVGLSRIHHHTLAMN